MGVHGYQAPSTVSLPASSPLAQNTPPHLEPRRGAGPLAKVVLRKGNGRLEVHLVRRDHVNNEHQVCPVIHPLGVREAGEDVLRNAVAKRHVPGGRDGLRWGVEAGAWEEEGSRLMAPGIFNKTHQLLSRLAR